MNNYSDAIVRLSYIISLLTSHDETEPRTFTINELNEITGIPLNILVKDIISLIESDFFNDRIKLCDVSSDLNLEKNDINFFKLSLINFDKSVCDIPLYIEYYQDNDLLGCSTNHMIFLDSMEKNLISKILKREIAGDIWIKESPFVPAKEICDLRDKIRLAIENNNPISFSYTDSSGKKTSYEEYNAYRIFETINEGVVYIIGINPDDSLDFKRLDRMLFHKSLDNKKMPPCNNKAFDRLDYMWDADLNNEDTPIKITLLIEENTKNIIPKIESETSRRKYGRLERYSETDKEFHKNYDEIVKKLIPDDPSEKTWIYTDKVLGMNSFKRWLRKYGSSVLVLEPKELAMEMKESAERKLENYKSFTDSDR